MLVHFQFPIIDFRFFNSENKRLNEPFNMLEEANVDCSGLYSKRNGHFKWPGKDSAANLNAEHSYFKAEKPIRIVDLTHQNLNNVLIQGKYRRLLLNQTNRLLSVYEIGFKDNITCIKLVEDNIQPYNKSLRRIIAHYENLPLEITGRTGKAREARTKIKLLKEGTTVGQASKCITRLYLESTTDASHAIEYENVATGKAIGIFEMDVANIDFRLDASELRWKFVADFKNGIKLYCSTNDRNPSVWIIIKDLVKGYDIDYVRNLRLNLQRIHQEKEAVEQLVKYLAKNKSYFKADADAKRNLEKHLDRLTNKIFEEKRFDIPQSMILQSTFDCDLDAKIKELDKFLQSLDIENKWMLSRLAIQLSNMKRLKDAFLYLVNASNIQPEQKQEIVNALEASNWNRVLFLLEKPIFILLTLLGTLTISAGHWILPFLPLLKFILETCIMGKSLRGK